MLVKEEDDDKEDIDKEEIDKKGEEEETGLRSGTL